MPSEEEDRGSLPGGALVGGRFRVERLIGRGGMGEVYAARHATTGKEVALKLIHSATGSGKEHVRRFMREARAATAIQHPNVIEVFDVFEDADGTPVMVMELLKGEPFSAFRERAGALRLHEVAELLLPAARALQAAHEKGIVHRDLKPDNVFLATTPAGRCTKLLDFGIAKVLDPTKISSETQGQQTNTGSILGTPHYMSYEQAMSDKHVDHRTDIWAMGVMIFEALTGRRPMQYDTLGQMYAAFLQGTVPSIREFVPDLPEDCARVLDQCLAKQRDARLGDLRPLADVLAKYADPRVPGADAGGRVVEAPIQAADVATNEPLSSSVARASPKRRSRGVVLAAAVVVGGAGIGAAVFFGGRHAPSASPQQANASAAPIPLASQTATEATLPSPQGSVSPSATASSAPPASAGGQRPAVGASAGRSTALPSPPARSATTAAAPGPSATQKHGLPESLPY